jgi:hypothetical protein
MRFIMGSRSIESAQNIVGAMVSRARNQAVNDNGTRGVFFFVDPVSDRTTMALVGQSGAGDLAQYAGWSANAGLPAYVDPQGNQVNLIPSYYQPGGQYATSSVVALSNNSLFTDSYSTYMKVPRAIVQPYSCILTHGNAPLAPPPNPSANNYPPNSPGGTTYWGPTSLSLELVSDTDFQVLPQGVGLQLINSNPAGLVNFDRYVRIGCILFDSKGRFVSVPWSISPGTTIGKAMGLQYALDLTGNGIRPLVSQFGMVLYDRQTYLAQAWPGGGGNFGEGDWIYSPSFAYAGYSPPPGGFFLPAYAPKFPSNYSDEEANNPTTSLPSKEQWLDNNSVPLLIDRYNGTLIKGE